MRIEAFVYDRDFVISCNQKKAALDAINAAYEWEEHSLEEALDELGWSVETDASGDIIDIAPLFDKLDEPQHMLSAIAPWVAAGSYICVMVDCDYLRWFFDGTQFLEQTPTFGCSCGASIVAASE